MQESINSGQELGPETRAGPACALVSLCGGWTSLIDNNNDYLDRLDASNTAKSGTQP